MPIAPGGPIIGSAFSSSGPPASHKASHVSGGGDAFAAADVLESAARTLRTPLRNETGSTIAKGTLVAVSGFSVPEGRSLVVVADKDDSTKRPAAAVTEAAVGNNTNFEGLVLGLLTGLNTSAFSVNDQLALGSAGAVSRPPPDTDPFTGEIQLIGSTVRIDASVGSIYFTLSSGLLPMTAAHLFAARETSPTGNVTGGEVTRVSGLDVAVASGSGFVNDGTDVFRVPFSAVANLTLTASDTNFIFVDKNGLVQASVSPPDKENNIILADAITGGSSVLLLANHQVLLTEHRAKFHDYAKDVVGNVVVSGLVTSQATAALRVKVDLGTFYTRDFRVTVAATDPVTFTYWFRDGSGGFNRVAGSTLIDKDNFDDGSGTLAALLTTEFKKDLLFVVFTATGAVEYHVFYGQEKFTSQALAEGGNLPAADSDVIANSVRSAGIVQEGAAAAIASFVDVRPFLGQLAPPVTSVSDHGLLSGLADDDHTQYMLADGTRAWSGDQDVGGNAITNVGNVDGVDVSAHKDRHKSGGGDAFAATDLIEAIVKRLQTTTGPTTLLMGAVADGEFLKRVGTDLVGAAAGGFPTLVFPAGALSLPNSADWAVNALAPLDQDPVNDGFGAILLDDTVEEGRGLEFFAPGATNIKITTITRAVAAPGGAVVAKMRVYNRGVPLTPAAVEAWSAATNLTDVALPITTRFLHYDVSTISFASLGLTAGELTQLEITRNGGDGGDTLVGDLSLVAVIIEFT